jgi:PEP-CTERM motif
MKKLVVLAGIALAFATPAAAQNIVNNGSFESGDFSGFTQTGNTGFTGVTTIGEGFIAPTDGNFFAFFGPVGSVGGINQGLATTIGQSYAISFDLQNDGGSTTSFDALFGSNSLFNLVNSPAAGFTTFSTTATATEALTNLSFSFRQDPAFFRLDNISVTALNGAVPEPATWAMMLLGFGMVGGSMRRRTSHQRALSLA